jgi:hypothetical protein
MAASVESSRHEAGCALDHGKRFGVEAAEKSEVKIARPAERTAVTTSNAGTCWATRGISRARALR